MQRLVFLTYFFQKLSKKDLWGVGSTPPGTGRVNTFTPRVYHKIFAARGERATS